MKDGCKVMKVVGSGMTARECRNDKEITFLSPHPPFFAALFRFCEEEVMLIGVCEIQASRSGSGSPSLLFYASAPTRDLSRHISINQIVH